MLSRQLNTTQHEGQPTLEIYIDVISPIGIIFYHSTVTQEPKLGLPES